MMTQGGPPPVKARRSRSGFPGRSKGGPLSFPPQCRHEKGRPRFPAGAAFLVIKLGLLQACNEARSFFSALASSWRMRSAETS